MTCDLTNPIFTDEEAARKHFEALRWPDGPICPFCQTSLSVSIDPVALKTDVVSEMTRAVKKLLGRP